MYVGRSQNAAACWSMCADSIAAEDLIAIDWWPYGYAGGQYRTCFCQMACTCLAEVGAGNTLLVATSFAELSGLPATCESMNGREKKGSCINTKHGFDFKSIYVVYI